MIRIYAIKTKHSQYVLMEAMWDISYWIWGRSWDTFRSLSERGQSGRASCSRLLGYCRFSGLLDCIVPPPNSASVRLGSRLHETKHQSIKNHIVACKLIRDDVTAGARTFLEEFVAFLFRLQSLFRINLCETLTFRLHLLHLDTTKAMTSQRHRITVLLLYHHVLPVSSWQRRGCDVPTQICSRIWDTHRGCPFCGKRCRCARKLWTKKQSNNVENG